MFCTYVINVTAYCLDQSYSIHVFLYVRFPLMKDNYNNILFIGSNDDAAAVKNNFFQTIPKPLSLEDPFSETIRERFLMSSFGEYLERL